MRKKSSTEIYYNDCVFFTIAVNKMPVTSVKLLSSTEVERSLLSVTKQKTDAIRIDS